MKQIFTLGILINTPLALEIINQFFYYKNVALIYSLDQILYSINRNVNAKIWFMASTFYFHPFFSTGDILGPTIQVVIHGISTLLRIPTGCGEQNLIYLAPNVYVTRYLDTVNKLSNVMKRKALTLIREGHYQILFYSTLFTICISMYILYLYINYYYFKLSFYYYSLLLIYYY